MFDLPTTCGIEKVTKFMDGMAHLAVVTSGHIFHSEVRDVLTLF